MAVGKAEVLAAIAEERRQVLEAIRKAQESAKPEDLSDLLAAVQGIYEENPVEEPEVTEESPAEITEDFVDIGVTAEPEAVTDGE